MKKLLMTLTAALMTLSVFFSGISWADTDGQSQEGEKNKGKITIVFSHDMHSHLEKFSRIKSVIDKEKSKNPATFILDGGDFSMGTPYQTIFKKEASELRMMGKVGYDATTLGNHEFDYRSKGVSQMLQSAAASGERLPAMVVSNIDWKKTTEEKDLKDDAERFKEALKVYGAEQEYLIFARGGVKIAVFGIMGKEAASYAPESGTYFKDPVETAQKIVDRIKEKEKADLIICLSHGGTSDNPDDSEDEILVEKVEGIDMIVSAHSHTVLDEPIVIGDTVVASAGQYNRNLGIVSFEKKKGEYVLGEYRLEPLDESVDEDAAITAETEKFKALVDRHYFGKYGYGWDDVLVCNPVAFTDIEKFGEEQGEDTLGNLIADSYIYGVKEAEGSAYEPVSLAVAPSGVIRGSFKKGEITVSDAFNALSLGTGEDGIAGYPLVSVYLTGKELKLAAEIDISVSELMSPARLYCSGLYYSYNPHRMILNRAYDIKVKDSDGNVREPEDDKLYRVVADLYSAQMLGTVNSMSYGLLSVVPKDKEGNEIEDYEEHIIYLKDGRELKEWYALAGYLSELSSDELAEKYEKPEGRKVFCDSRSIGNLLKQPNRFFFMITGIVAAVAAVVILIAVLIVRKIRKIRKKKGGRYRS